MTKDSNGNSILPTETPKEIVDWVRGIEDHVSVSCLSQLPSDASIEQIHEAFELDRITLIGIGEDIYEKAQWNAWDSYEFHLENE